MKVREALERVSMSSPARSRHPLLFFSFYIGANAFDAVSTWWGITSQVAAEGNPLILELFDKLGFWGTSALKMLIALVVARAKSVFAYLSSEWSRLTSVS